MTQRLNITIPDELHEQLEPLRERVNISKVCTTALEEEVARLTTPAETVDPRVAEILDRLIDQGEFWYDRGYADGETWATKEASRAQLEYHAGCLAGLPAEELLRCYQEQEIGNKDADDLPLSPSLFPSTGNMSDAHFNWVEGDNTVTLEGISLGIEPNVNDVRWPDVLDSIGSASNAGFGSYLEGWRDAVVELWGKVSEALKQTEARRRSTRKGGISA